jgi:hypothetical protein
MDHPLPGYDTKNPMTEQKLVEEAIATNYAYDKSALKNNTLKVWLTKYCGVPSVP